MEHRRDVDVVMEQLRDVVVAEQRQDIHAVVELRLDTIGVADTR
jgi:hypothetical protein